MSAADSLPDFIGRILDDRYELLQVLGAGSFGVVYRALDTHELLYVAVKIIGKASRKTCDIAAIRAEVELHARVSDQPGVVSLIDAFEDSQYFYIVLDYCDGGDLFDQACVNEIYIGDDELLKSAFLSLIDAVQSCHKANIAHRDLKPENVLTSKDGSRTYLADFGMATTKRISDEFGSGTTIYMAPECYGGTGMPYCTHTADVWALGVILYNMIGNQNPWQTARSSDEAFYKFTQDRNTLFATLPISEEAFAVLIRVFEPNPLKRITLSKLREAIMSIDTFFRMDPDSPILITEEELESIPSASEIDILCAPEYELWEGQDCSAGFTAFDYEYANFYPTTTTTPELSPVSSRASSGDSEMEDRKVVTPEHTQAAPTTPTKEHALYWRSGHTAQRLIAQYNAGC